MLVSRLQDTRIYQEAYAEGFHEGFLKGFQKGYDYIALKLLERGDSLEGTAEILELSIAEILELSIADLQHLTQQNTNR